MGYWAQAPDGRSFVDGVRHADEHDKLIWGDAPADILDAGKENLIRRLATELGRKPTVDEVDLAALDAPEMAEAITKASEAFAEDVGRKPTQTEITAGLNFSSTALALHFFKE